MLLLAANECPLAPRHIAVFALGVGLGAGATCVYTCANGFLARVHHSDLLLALLEDYAVVLLLIQLGEKLGLELRGVTIHAAWYSVGLGIQICHAISNGVREIPVSNR